MQIDLTKLTSSQAFRVAAELCGCNVERICKAVFNLRNQLSLDYAMLLKAGKVEPDNADIRKLTNEVASKLDSLRIVSQVAHEITPQAKPTSRAQLLREIREKYRY